MQPDTVQAKYELKGYILNFKTSFCQANCNLRFLTYRKSIGPVVLLNAVYLDSKEFYGEVRILNKRGNECKNLSSTSGFQCFIDVVGNFGKIHGNVGLRHIQKLESLVFDAERPIKILVRVNHTLAWAFGSVQDMSNTNFLQVKCILSSTSEMTETILCNKELIFQATLVLIVSATIVPLSTLVFGK